MGITNMGIAEELIIGTQNSRRFLLGGEAVRFFVVNALRPVWVKTPWAVYPLLPHEEITIVMPKQVGMCHISFTCGKSSVDYAYYVS